MGIEALGWVKKVWDWCGGPKVGVNGQGKVRMTRDGYRGPEIGVKGFLVVGEA